MEKIKGDNPLDDPGFTGSKPSCQVTVQAVASLQHSIGIAGIDNGLPAPAPGVYNALPEAVGTNGPMDGGDVIGSGGGIHISGDGGGSGGGGWWFEGNSLPGLRSMGSIELRSLDQMLADDLGGGGGESGGSLPHATTARGLAGCKAPSTSVIVPVAAANVFTPVVQPSTVPAMHYRDGAIPPGSVAASFPKEPSAIMPPPAPFMPLPLMPSYGGSYPPNQRGANDNFHHASAYMSFQPALQYRDRQQAPGYLEVLRQPGAGPDGQPQPLLASQGGVQDASPHSHVTSAPNASGIVSNYVERRESAGSAVTSNGGSTHTPATERGRSETANPATGSDIRAARGYVEAAPIGDSAQGHFNTSSKDRSMYGAPQATLKHPTHEPFGSYGAGSAPPAYGNVRFPIPHENQPLHTPQPFGYNAAAPPFLPTAPYQLPPHGTAWPDFDSRQHGSRYPDASFVGVGSGGNANTKSQPPVVQPGALQVPPPTQPALPQGSAYNCRPPIPQPVPCLPPQYHHQPFHQRQGYGDQFLQEPHSQQGQQEYVYQYHQQQDHQTRYHQHLHAPHRPIPAPAKADPWTGMYSSAGFDCNRQGIQYDTPHMMASVPAPQSNSEGDTYRGPGGSGVELSRHSFHDVQPPPYPQAARERQMSTVSDCSVALQDLVTAGSADDDVKGLNIDGRVNSHRELQGDNQEMRGAMLALLQGREDDEEVPFLQRGGSTAAAAAAAFGGAGLLFPASLNAAATHGVGGGGVGSHVPGGGNSSRMELTFPMGGDRRAAGSSRANSTSLDGFCSVGPADAGASKLLRSQSQPQGSAGRVGQATGLQPLPPRARGPKRTAAVAAMHKMTGGKGPTGSLCSSSGGSSCAEASGRAGGNRRRCGKREPARGAVDADYTERADEEENVVEGDGVLEKQRSSQYRGVTRHRRSGRWEAHIWVKSIGRQVYLGGYEQEDHAAEAYDVAALKCKGTKGIRTNFPLSRYSELLPSLQTISLEELIMAVRRQSQGFSRGSSTYRGVTAHPSGRWESRIGIPGSKHIYLGLFERDRDAAAAYDRSLVRLRGPSAATNFPLSEYRPELSEYHVFQQAITMQDSRMSHLIQQTGSDYEKWIKIGFKDFEIQGMLPDAGGIDVCGGSLAATDMIMRSIAIPAAAATSNDSPIAAVMAMAAAAAPEIHGSRAVG